MSKKTKQEIIEWLEKEIKLHKEVEAETWNQEQQKLKDFIVGLESVFDCIHRSSSETEASRSDAQVLCSDLFGSFNSLIFTAEDKNGNEVAKAGIYSKFLGRLPYIETCFQLLEEELESKNLSKDSLIFRVRTE